MMSVTQTMIPNSGTTHYAHPPKSHDGGRAAPEPRAYPPFGYAERRFEDGGARREDEPDDAGFGAVADGERAYGLDGDVRRKQEEADRDEPLCP
jgi:hypothetical protein